MTPNIATSVKEVSFTNLINELCLHYEIVETLEYICNIHCNEISPKQWGPFRHASYKYVLYIHIILYVYTANNNKYTVFINCIYV